VVVRREQRGEVSGHILLIGSLRATLGRTVVLGMWRSLSP